MPRQKPRSAGKPAVPPPSRPAPVLSVPAARALGLPLIFTLALFAFLASETVRQTPGLVWAFGGAGAVLLGWILVLLAARARSGRRLQIEITLRKQHYLQACAQSAVYLYWGWHWREVYDFAYL